MLELELVLVLELVLELVLVLVLVLELVLVPLPLPLPLPLPPPPAMHLYPRTGGPHAAANKQSADTAVLANDARARASGIVGNHSPSYAAAN